MNSIRILRRSLLLFLASGLIFGAYLRAEEKTPEVPAVPTEPAPSVVAEDDRTEAAPAAVLPAAPATPAVEAPVAVEAAKDAERPAAPAAEAEKAPAAEPPAPPTPPAEHQRHRGHNERFSIFSNSVLEEGQSARAVVSIMGSSTSAGEVHDAVVSVLGGSRVTGGTVGGAVVSVLGNTYVNGHVRREVVTVLGDVELGPKAVVEGEIVCVGGRLLRDPAAVVRGNVQNIAIGGQHFNFGSLTTYLQKCVMYGRPLAFDGQLLWAWGIAMGFLVVYLLIALVAPRGVVRCTETLEQHPGSSLVAAILTMLLTPVAYILLVFTLALAIGVVLIPLFSTGLFVASIFGKVVMLAWLGRRFLGLMGEGAPKHPVVAVLLGGAVVLLLYTVPILGFVTYKLLGILGLGVVVYTLILQMKASRAARPAPIAPLPKAAVAAPAVSAPGVAAASGVTMPSAAEAPPVMPALPAVISAATLPRVGFWLRIAASLLDAILIGMLCGLVGSIWHNFGSAYLLWYATYCVIMWATKGTTIGGIICGLKVVRLDDRPIDWGVAVVRALGGFLSLAVAGLGFVWVAFDDDRQSWHDKIAGTTIVRVPRGTSLM